MKAPPGHGQGTGPPPPQVPRGFLTQRVSPGCRVPLGMSPSTTPGLHTQQPDCPPTVLEVPDKIYFTLWKCLATGRHIIQVLPWLGGGEKIARISWDRKDGNASSIAQGPWHPAPPPTGTVGQLRLWGAEVVLGKPLLPTPPGPSQRHFFCVSYRTAFCLSPFPYHTDGRAPFHRAPLPAGYPCPFCLPAP